MTDHELEQQLTVEGLFSLADALLASLARGHEECCAQAAYTLQLALDDLASGPRRFSSITLPVTAPPLAVPGGAVTRVRILRLLEGLIPLAVNRDEEEALISAHHWTCFAHLDH